MSESPNEEPIIEICGVIIVYQKEAQDDDDEDELEVYCKDKNNSML